MAMNRARRTSNLNNILTYDTLGNSTLIANLTVEGLTGAGFVKADAAGLLSVDTAAYTVTTGTTNYLTKITGANTLGQSLVYDNGTSVLVNSTTGVPGYTHAFQVVANAAGGLVVSTTDVASAIGIVNSSSANKTWDISPYGNHLVINESGIATRMKFDAGGNITIGDIVNSGHKLEIVGSFRTTGTNTLSQLQGVGDRMVVANTNGVLSTQAIPTGSITGSGAAGQVNFWTGTNTVGGSNNLFWDAAQGRLGIGTNSPSFIVDIQSSNFPYLQIQSTTDTQTSNGRAGLRISRGSSTTLQGFDFVKNALDNLEIRGLSFGSATTFATLFRSTGNIVLQNGGTFTDGGQRLQVYGDTLLRGSGATLATTALTIQDSSSNNLFSFRNNGTLVVPIIASQASPVIQIHQRVSTSNNGSYIPILRYGNTIDDVSQHSQMYGFWNSGNVGGFRFNHPAGSGGGGVTFNFIPLINQISSNVVNIQQTFTATSGAETITQLLINPTIDQTGTSTGITRGVYVNPSITAAPSWRSIEWGNSLGWGLYGAGAANNYLAGNLGVGTLTTTDWLNIGASTTAKAQIFLTAGVDPTTPTDGDIWATSTDIKARVGGTTYSLINSGLSGSGTAGQVTYWNSASGLTGSANLFWDNTNGRLGINNNTPTSALFLYTNTSSTTESGNSGFILHNNNPSQTVGNLTELFFSDAGQGTGTANGLNLLHRYAGIAGFVNQWNAQSSGGGLNLVTKATTAAALTTKLQIRPGGNVIIQDGGTFTDAGFRLDVQGTARTTGTHRVGQIFFGTNGQGSYLFPHAGTAGVADQNGINLTFFNYATSTTPEGSWAFAGELINATSGVHSGIRYQKGFSPASGTATHTAMEFIHTINQAGGANGVTRAIRISPSIVTAADFRAIEWANNSGWGLYGVGSSLNYLNGALLIGSATNDTVNKLQVTGTIVAGSATSTNGSVILRGSYTSGYLTTIGTDASSGGPIVSYGVESAQNSTAGAFVSSSGIAIPRSAYVQTGGHIWYTAASSTTAIGTAITMTKHMELYNSGNLVLGGGADDATNRLQVGGSFKVVGAASTTVAAIVAGTNTEDNNIVLNISRPNGGKIFTLRDRASIEIGNNNLIYPSTGDANATILRAANGLFFGQIDGTTTTAEVWNISLGRPSNVNNQPATGTSGGLVQVIGQFNPASGSVPFTSLRLAPTINQTGTANGTTRGVHVNPTFTTTPTDWRSIEWSNNTGWGLYGVGTAKNYLNGTTLIGTATDDGINKLQVAGSISATTDSVINGVTIGKGGGSGALNTAVGNLALSANTTGASNTAFGLGALGTITTGSENVGVGTNAGRYRNGTTANSDSSGGIYIGFASRASAAATTNEIVIGSGAQGSGNNTVTIGNTGIVSTVLRGAVSSNGLIRSDASRTAAINDVSIALLGSNITTYAAGFTMAGAGYGLNAVYAQHEQRFGGNADFDSANLVGAGLMINKLAPTAAGTITMGQVGSGRTMSNLHLMTQFEGNNNLTVTHMSGLHIYGHYRTSGTGTITVSTAYYGILLADPNEFGAGATITGTNWGFYQAGTAPNNYFGGKVLIGTTTTTGTSKLRISGLPTSAAGLGAGEVWNDAGTLKIA